MQRINQWPGEILVFFIFLLVTLLSAFSHADTYYLQSSNRSNLPPDDLMAVEELVRIAVSENKHSMVEEKQEARFYLFLRVVRVGEATVISLVKKKAKKTMFSARMKALTPEEMDLVTKRLVRAVINEVDPKKDTRVDDVTKEEVDRGTNRKRSRRPKLISVGPVYTNGLETNRMGLGLTYGYGFDINTVLIRFSATMAHPVRTKSAWLDGVIGANVFLSNRDFAPYIGADFGYGVVRKDVDISLNPGTDTSTGGLILAALIGAQLIRTSDVNIDLGFRVAYLFGESTFGKPVLYSFRIGVLY